MAVSATKQARIERMHAGAPEVPHGLSGYANWGCRCDKCKAANTVSVAAQRARRAARAAEDPSIVPHGEGGYTNWGCRCDTCTKEHTRMRQEQRT
jgi:hypothetical protein